MWAIGKISRLDTETRDVAGATGSAGELHLFAHGHTTTDEQVDLLLGSHGGDDLLHVAGVQFGLCSERRGSECQNGQNLCTLIVFHLVIFGSLILRCKGSGFFAKNGFRFVWKCYENVQIL